MENPVAYDKEVLHMALAAVEKAEELFADGKAAEAVDLWFTARKAVREQFDIHNVLGVAN